MTGLAVATAYTAADDCGANLLEPGRSCLVQIPEEKDGFCTVVTSSAKVRPAVNVMTTGTNTLLTVVPATK